MILLILCFVYAIAEEMPNDAYKDQFCTDPRTMKKHAAYTEWADAYSCTRHRCQPGGRNLAIYTVGCKRVEAPESAIECEEVVEDTNMQFPYCCTRLRCLVVVRGEVWTRVLGQPWETLPAAPWSHMYKMKKPPPGNEFLPKNANEGPVYELTDSDNDKPREKVMRAKPDPSFSEGPPKPPQSPDIVIALTTNKEQKDQLIKTELSDRKRHKAQQAPSQYFDEEAPSEPREEPEEALREKQDPINVVKEWVKENATPTQDQPAQPDASEEGRDGRDYYSYSYQNKKSKGQRQRDSEVPANQWNDPDQDPTKDISYRQQDLSPTAEPLKKSVKPQELQNLVDAIGSRMRDIESVVHKMSENIQKPEDGDASNEKGGPQDSELHGKNSLERKAKKPSSTGDEYKRFTVRNRGSKYLHGSTDSTTEAPVFAEPNGYFSDASNSVLRRSNPRIEPKEPSPPTYMAPVENRRKAHPPSPTTSEEKPVRKHRKRTHKKKKRAGKVHKRHHKDVGKTRKFNRANSVESDRIIISLEDSSAANSKK